MPGTGTNIYLFENKIRQKVQFSPQFLLKEMSHTKMYLLCWVVGLGRQLIHHFLLIMSELVSIPKFSLLSCLPQDLWW